MNPTKPLLLFAAVALLSTGVAQAQVIDVAIVNDGTNTTLTFEATGAAATLPLGTTSTTGSTGDGIDLYNFFAEGGIGFTNYLESSNAGGTGYNYIVAPPTGDLTTSANADNSSKEYNALLGDSFSDQADEENLNLYSLSGSVGDQTFSSTSAAFIGTDTWVLNDASDSYLINDFLPPLNDSGEVVAGWSLSTNPSYGLGTPNVDVGTWKIVSYDDLPSELGSGAGAAPEPRSWIMAGMVAMVFLGLCLLRLRSLDQSEATT